MLLGRQDAPCRGTRARVCPQPGHPCLDSVSAQDIVAAVAEVSAAAPRNRRLHRRPRPSVHRPAAVRRRGGQRADQARPDHRHRPGTLWFAWLRRPLPSALRRTVRLAACVPRDATSVRAFAEAAAGPPWVLDERRVLPDRGRRACGCSKPRSGYPAPAAASADPSPVGHGP